LLVFLINNIFSYKQFPVLAQNYEHYP